MPLNIKNSEVHERAKELARITGESVTHAVAAAIDDSLERERRRRQQEVRRREEVLMDIAAECARFGRKTPMFLDVLCRILHIACNCKYIGVSACERLLDNVFT